MAGDYWEVGQWKKTPNDKNFFVKLGTAKQKDDGGFYVDLDALPLSRPDNNGNLRCSIVIQPQREKGEYRGGGNAKRGNTEEDTGVPF
jgi:hypothetical protein